MNQDFSWNNFVDNLRQNLDFYYEEWWPHFLTFSEQVDTNYIFAAPGLIILFLVLGHFSSIVNFVLLFSLVIISIIKIWKYFEDVERKTRRKPITIEPIITTSGSFPRLQKRKYININHLSSEDASDMNEDDEDGASNASSSKYDYDDTSTIGGPQEGSRRNQRYPLSVRELSAVTSPGFITRIVKQADLHNGYNDGRNWNRSPFQYSPDKDLQVGEVAYGSKFKPYRPETRPPMDIISWTRTRSLTPPRYVSVKPREPELDKFSDYVHSTSKLRHDMSPNRNGGLGGTPNSSFVARSNSQLLASANNILETSKSSPSPYNHTTNTTSSSSQNSPPSSILEALANRKRIRDSEAGFQSPQSPNQSKRASIPSMYNEDLAKKRVKFLSHDSNAVIPPYSMMPLPDLRVNDDDPMMATGSILDQLNQTEKRYLPEDDTPAFRPGPKKMKPNNAIGSRSIPGTSPARKRKMINPMGPLEDEVQEKTTRMCNCTECYDELAGAKVDQYGSNLNGSSNGNHSSRETRSKTLRKVVDQATETEPDEPVITSLVETTKPRVITKEQFKHDKNLRKKRLQIMLELSKEKKSQLQTPSPTSENGFASATSAVSQNPNNTFGFGTPIVTTDNSQNISSTTSTMLSASETPTTAYKGTNEIQIQPLISSVAPAVATTASPVSSVQSNPITQDTPDQGNPTSNKPKFNFGFGADTSTAATSTGTSEVKTQPLVSSVGSTVPTTTASIFVPSNSLTHNTPDQGNPTNSKPQFNFRFGETSTNTSTGGSELQIKPLVSFAPGVTTTTPPIFGQSSLKTQNAPSQESSTSQKPQPNFGSGTGEFSFGGTPTTGATVQPLISSASAVTTTVPIFGQSNPITQNAPSQGNSISDKPQINFGSGAGGFNFVPPGGISAAAQGASPNPAPMFLFGNTSTSGAVSQPSVSSGAPAATTSTPIFGQSSSVNNAPATTTTSIFGQSIKSSSVPQNAPATITTPVFGQSSSVTQTAPATITTPIFGQSSSVTQNAPATTIPIFGQSSSGTQNVPATTTSIFGHSSSVAQNTSSQGNSTSDKPQFSFASGTSGFNFASPGGTSGASPSPTPFSFGGTPTGVASRTLVSSVASAVTTTAPIFGQSNATAQNTTTTTQENPGKPQFNLFGSGSGPGGFNFSTPGGTSTLASEASPSPAPMFAFGNSTPIKGAASQPLVAPTTPIFGQTQSAPNQSNPQFNFASGTAGGFNFNTPGGTSSAAAPGTSPSQAPMFSFNSTPTDGSAAPPRRRITARGRKYR